MLGVFPAPRRRGLYSSTFFTSKKKKLWGRGPSVLPPVLELGAGYPVPRSGVAVYHISL